MPEGNNPAKPDQNVFPVMEHPERKGQRADMYYKEMITQGRSLYRPDSDTAPAIRDNALNGSFATNGDFVSQVEERLVQAQDEHGTLKWRMVGYGISAIENGNIPLGIRAMRLGEDERMPDDNAIMKVLEKNLPMASVLPEVQSYIIKNPVVPASVK